MFDGKNYDIYMIPKHPEFNANGNQSIEILGSSIVLYLFFMDKNKMNNEVIIFKNR